MATGAWNGAEDAHKEKLLLKYWSFSIWEAWGEKRKKIKLKRLKVYNSFISLALRFQK